MKFTCLSRGKGYHFPPCHILDVCGVRILFDCPLDLAALTVFSPLPTDYQTPLGTSPLADKECRNIENFDDARKLLMTQPWYKTVWNLQLWDIYLIDIVLVSSPMGILGLPFLTRSETFSAKIYATEATSRVGQLMMEDLLAMHKEYIYFYGPDDSQLPRWMMWKELESLPFLLREIISGSNADDLPAWMPLYSAADVKHCMENVVALKYAEEARHNGVLIIEAFASGLEIGACNWSIHSPKGNIAYISSSIFQSSVARSADYHAFLGKDLILFSDFSFLRNVGGLADANWHTNAVSGLSFSSDTVSDCLQNNEDSIEETKKLAFIRSTVLESLAAGGSAVIAVGQLGINLQLMELISSSLASMKIKVPIYFISSVSDELLAFTNMVPEWLCSERQKKLYAGEPLFGHGELLTGKMLHTLPFIHSPKLLTVWQEPCVIFASHWSLRLGPAVHLLRLWRKDSRSLLIMEQGLNSDLALLPFKPLAMKVIQCSFLSGITLEKILPLLLFMAPKFVLMPKELESMLQEGSDIVSFSPIFFSENETLRIPNMGSNLMLEIDNELTSQMKWVSLEGKGIQFTRLKGRLFVDRGVYRLVHDGGVNGEPTMRWGALNIHLLTEMLQRKGIKGSVVRGDDDDGCGVLDVCEPGKARVEITSAKTVIVAPDQILASLIFHAVDEILQGI